MPQPAERLRQAAFELFERQGYDATTVDQIAELAGVGRTTFFRLFRSKEDVIFPDHTEVLTRVRARLGHRHRRRRRRPRSPRPPGWCSTAISTRASSLAAGTG